MTKNLEITVNLLKAFDACDSQIALFRKTFGKSAKITKTNLRKAYKVGLDIHWLLQKKKMKNLKKLLKCYIKYKFQKGFK